MSVISDGLFLPVVFLGLVGWLVPKLLSMVMPEGVKPLMALAFLAACILCVFSAVFFFVLYLMNGASLSVMAEQGIIANLWFFGRLGLSTAIVWGPILILSVANLPRNWVRETW